MTLRHADPLGDMALAVLARQAMACYPAQFRDAHPEILTRSENATFRVEAGGRRYALRVHRPNYHSKTDVENELAWLDAIKRDIGVVVPTAIAGLLGQRVLTLRAPDGTDRYAVLFDWIDGDMPTSGLEPTSFQQLGQITARLHQHSKSWARPENFHRIVWDHETMVGPDAHWGDWRETTGLDANDRNVIAQAMDDVGRKLRTYGKSATRYGLIHADLRLTNLLRHEDQTRVIDFDDCGMGWFMHDLAAAISFEELHPNASEWVANWLSGYARIAPVTDADIAIMPSLFVQRRVQMTAWVGSHLDTDMARSLPPTWVGQTAQLCRLYLEGNNILMEQYWKSRA